MDQATSGTTVDQAVNGQDGLAQKVAAVEQARVRLGHDLDQLSTEVRSQVNVTMQRTVWRLAATGAAVLAGLAARKGMNLVWKAVVHRDPPDKPETSETRWVDALGWTMATGVAVGVAQLVAKRGTAAGWQKATGVPPPA